MGALREAPRLTVADVLALLDGVRPAGAGHVARCPAHDDRHPSLGIKEGDTGAVVLKCHAGCETEAVVEALGLSMEQLFPERVSPLPRRSAARAERKPSPLSAEEVGGWHAALRADPQAWRHVTEALGFSPEVVERLQFGLRTAQGRRWLVYPYQRGESWTFANCRSLDGPKTFTRFPSGQKTHLYQADSLEDGGTAVLVEGERDAAAALTMGLGAELGGEAGAAIVAIPGAEQIRVAVEGLDRQSVVYIATDSDSAGDAAAAKVAAQLPHVRCLRACLEGFKDLGDLLASKGLEGGRSAALKAFRAARPLQSAPATEQPEPESQLTSRERLASRWKTFTAADLGRPPPKKEFIWEDRIPAGDAGVFAGAGAGGKTTLLVGLAIHRAMGRTYLGKHLRQGTTVIVSTEDGADDYRRKIAAWREVMWDMDLAAVARHVHVVDLGGTPFRLIEADGRGFARSPQVDDLLAELEQRAPEADLVILETVSRLGGDESNPAMSEMVCAAERIADATGAAVLLVTHVAKAVAREKSGDAYAPRGGSAIVDNGRFTLTLSGLAEDRAEELAGAPVSAEEAKGLMVFHAPKVNAAPAQEPVILQRVGTPWGLTLRLYQPAVYGSVEETKQARSHVIGEQLRALAQRFADRGEQLTESKLNAGLFKEIPGLSKHRIPAAVLEAIEAGLLKRGPAGRGGGHGALLPGDVGGSNSPKSPNSPAQESDRESTRETSENEPSELSHEPLSRLRTGEAGEFHSLPASPSRPAATGRPPRESSAGEFGGSKAGGA